MTKTVLVPVANGSEELEAVAIVDVLRRTGADVTMASVQELRIIASKGVKIEADCLVSRCAGKQYDLIVLPGGMPGSEHLRDSKELVDMLKDQKAAGRLFGAMCSAPAVVFEHHGLITGRRVTCHPAFRHLIKSAELVDQPVVVDGTLITSGGAGTAVAFGLVLAELLYDKAKVREVAKGMAMDTD